MRATPRRHYRSGHSRTVSPSSASGMSGALRAPDRTPHAHLRHLFATSSSGPVEGVRPENRESSRAAPEFGIGLPACPALGPNERARGSASGIPRAARRASSPRAPPRPSGCPWKDTTSIAAPAPAPVSGWRSSRASPMRRQWRRSYPSLRGRGPARYAGAELGSASASGTATGDGRHRSRQSRSAHIDRVVNDSVFLRLPFDRACRAPSWPHHCGQPRALDGRQFEGRPGGNALGPSPIGRRTDVAWSKRCNQDAAVGEQDFRPRVLGGLGNDFEPAPLRSSKLVVRAGRSQPASG